MAPPDGCCCSAGSRAALSHLRTPGAIGCLGAPAESRFVIAGVEFAVVMIADARLHVAVLFVVLGRPEGRSDLSARASLTGATRYQYRPTSKQSPRSISLCSEAVATAWNNGDLDRRPGREGTGGGCGPSYDGGRVPRWWCRSCSVLLIKGRQEPGG